MRDVFLSYTLIVACATVACPLKIPDRAGARRAPTSTQPANFGIGVYTDTTGSPAIEDQLDLARNLTGEGGFVTLYLCSWRDANRSCMNASVDRADQTSVDMLNQAYSRKLNVIARIGNPYYVRNHADNISLAPKLSFRSLAQAYARFVDSLPPPPNSGSFLYVHIGNEFNACNEWRCDEKGAPYTSSTPFTSLPILSSDNMAIEVSAFYRDVGAALEPVRARRKGYLRYANGPISNWDTTPCECGTGKPLGIGQTGLKWLDKMFTVNPIVYAKNRTVDWFASHAYPYQSAWGTKKATQGLLYYKNETRLVQLPDSISVGITETGWRTDGFVTSSDRANWTVEAYRNAWSKDSHVFAVTPFLLAGTFWQEMGWSWINVSAEGILQPLPVYGAMWSELRPRGLWVG